MIMTARKRQYTGNIARGEKDSPGLSSGSERAGNSSQFALT